MPPSTSVGQWTYRYSREKAITPASTAAGFHSGLPEAHRANTAAKDTAVWPEGKDASAGGAVSSSTAVFTAKGRTRPTRGFKIMLQQTRSKIRAKERDTPVHRCFFHSSSTAASRIQISPWLQVQLIQGSTASRKPHCRCAWIQSSTASSAVCIRFTLLSPGAPPGTVAVIIPHFPQGAQWPPAVSLPICTNSWDFSRFLESAVDNRRGTW